LEGERLRALHAKIDSNGNGHVSRDELVEFHADVERRKVEAAPYPESMDLDKDGLISREEWEKENTLWHFGPEGTPNAAAHRRLEMRKFEVADADGDGKLGPAEFRTMESSAHEGMALARAEHRIERHDKNGDGLITMAEFSRWTPESEISKQEEAMFKGLDRDGSGALSKEELLALDSGRYHLEEHIKALFRHADANSDGLIASHELAGADINDTADVYHELKDWLRHHEL